MFSPKLSQYILFYTPYTIFSDSEPQKISQKSKQIPQNLIKYVIQWFQRHK